VARFIWQAAFTGATGVEPVTSGLQTRPMARRHPTPTDNEPHRPETRPRRSKSMTGFAGSYTTSSEPSPAEATQALHKRLLQLQA
jgi:hypothetical protein